MSVVTLRKTQPSENVVGALRRIADELEEAGDPISTAVLCLGHLGSETPGDGNDMWQDLWWRTYGFGPRHDAFTVRGLMATCIRNWDTDAA